MRLATVAIPLGLFLFGAEASPDTYEYEIAAGISLAALIPADLYLRRKRQKFRTSLADRSFLYAFEAFTALKSYAEKELEAEKKEAKDAVESLIDGLDSRWSISEKSGDKPLEDFDYLMNPTVKLMMILQNAYLPVVEGGIKNEIIEIIPYFEKLSFFFHNPNNTLLNDLFDSARPAPPTKDENDQTVKSFKKHAWVKHSSALTGSAVAGFGSFYVLQPLSPDNIFQPLMVGLTVGFGIAGLYVGFIKNRI